MPTYSVHVLEKLLHEICLALGANEREAHIVARHLVDADLCGHKSHGVMRIIQYFDEVNSGKIQPASSISILDDWDTGAVIDASGPFGQVACHDAMQLAIDKARQSTLAAVTLRHCNHSGRLGTYVEIAAEANMLGIVTANGGGAGQWVAPFGGCQPRLSTNPIAFGMLSGMDFPIVLDMSTSIAPEGKIRDYLQRGESLPDGWLVNADGQATNDPQALYANPPGALMPFGGNAGYKAYGLAFMVDALSGALSQAGCPRAGTFRPNHGSGLFMMAINIERFGPTDEFSHRISEMSNYFKSSRTTAGVERILVPGEHEFLKRQELSKRGIFIPETVWKDICSIAEQLNRQEDQAVISLPKT